MTMTRKASAGRCFARHLYADRRGLALLEFAFSLPLVLGIGLYGVETANLALVNLRVSQIALNLADNASRVGSDTSLNVQQLREVDMNDVLQGARYQGTSIKLTTYGRITVSSLENVQQSYDAAPTQRIHWQRCIGMAGNPNGTIPDPKYKSEYGVAATSPIATYLPGAVYDPTAAVDTDTSTNDNSSSHPGSLAPTGMGDPGSQVQAPSSSAVMFVEINYLYQPLISAYLAGTGRRIHYIASFIVRDKRDFSEIYNPSPTSTASTCDKFTA